MKNIYIGIKARALLEYIWITGGIKQSFLAAVRYKKIKYKLRRAGYLASRYLGLIADSFVATSRLQSGIVKKAS